MTSSRFTRIPIEHVKTELAAFPLASEKALKLALIDLCPKLENDTASLWRHAEKQVVGSFPGFSVDEGIAIRDYFWFSQQPVSKIPLHCYLRKLATSFLEPQGAVAIPNLPPCLYPNGDDSRAHKPLARQTWWWLSVALPPDILLAALHSQFSHPDRIETVSPLLDRQLSDHGFAETHLHMGVGMDFRTVWISALVAIADFNFKHDAFQSTGAVLDEGKLLAPWLIRAAIMRYILAAYLCYGEQDSSLESYIARTVRYKLSQASEIAGYSLLIKVVSELQQGQLCQVNNQQKSFVSLQMLYKRLVNVSKRCDFDDSGGILLCDPIANMFPQVRHQKIPADLCFISASLHYLDRKHQNPVQDTLFATMFWQVIRIQSLLHRHVVQRPLTPGLQWFLRHYSHSSPIRKVLDTKDLVVSSAKISGLGRGLTSLELRTSPFNNNSELLTFTRAVKEVSQQIQEKYKLQTPLEVGIVFHFIKQRGGNAEKGEPIAHGKNSNADPASTSCNTQGYRFATYYLQKKREALPLIWLLTQQPSALQTIRGLDVCTDELAVPGWVLAPIINEVRQQSIVASSALRSIQGLEVRPLQMTAHTGEDFIHLFTGLRNIDETIEQFKLTQGDRIGHAVALGINPEKWAQSTGRIPVKREDRLFDLIWLWSCYGQNASSQDYNQKKGIEHEIAKLSHQIFDGVVDAVPTSYELYLLKSDLCDITKLTATGFPEGTWCVNQHIKKSLLYNYLTSAVIFQRGQELVWIDPGTEGTLLLHTQNELRRKIGILGITIEVNPSSNLLIGDMGDLHSHPLWRLRPPIPIDNVPPVSICIGSDDPLVFSTDLRQEYQRVLDALITTGMSDIQAEQWVDQTRADGLNCRFTLPVQTSSIQQNNQCSQSRKKNSF